MLKQPLLSHLVAGHLLVQRLVEDPGAVALVRGGYVGRGWVLLARQVVAGVIFFVLAAPLVLVLAVRVLVHLLGLLLVRLLLLLAWSSLLSLDFGVLVLFAGDLMLSAGLGLGLLLVVFLPLHLDDLLLWLLLAALAR